MCCRNIYVSENAHLMYVACGFETAWHKNYESPWCRIFSLDDFKVNFKI